MLNLSFDQYALAGIATADRVNSGSVFISAWQMKQQVCHLADAKRPHFVGKFRSYAMKIR